MNKLRIFVSLMTLAVLVIIIFRMDLTALRQSLSRISWTTIVCCLALVQVQIVLSALRWRFTSHRLGREIPVFIAVREYYVASLLNQTLPGGVSGDAVRAWRMRGREPGGWKQPAKAVVYERLSGQIAFFALAIAGVIIWPFATEADFEPYVRHFAIFAVALIGAVVLALLVKRWKGISVGMLHDELLEVFVRRKAWLFHSLVSLSILSAYVGVFFIAARATGSDFSWVACLTIIPLCLIAMLIPTGFGGWGTREAAAMALWPALGATSVDGLAASITYGWLSLAGAGPGIAFLAVDAFRKKPGHA